MSERKAGSPDIRADLDHVRGAAGEQQHNAVTVAGLPSMFSLRDWHDRDGLRDIVLRALEVAMRGVRSTGQRGNDSAAAFVCGLISGDRLSLQGAVL